MPWFRTVVGAVLALSLSPNLAKAEDTVASLPPTEIDSDAGDVVNSSIVWLKKGTSPEQVRATAVAFAGNADAILSIYDTLGGFAVRMSPEAARERLSFLRAHAAGDRLQNIEPNGYVELFDTDEFDCNNATAEDLAGSELPVGSAYWLGQVGGPLQPKAANFASKVWIIDSGIARIYNQNANKELNIDTGLSVECNDTGCLTEANGGNWNDKLGHGTMVAGIIGSIRNNSRGFVGVAPDVSLVAVKVFKKSAKARWTAIYKAVDYVSANANVDDVVNISWGARWDPEPYDPMKMNYNPRKIEADLRALAASSRKIRVAIAAGNANQIQNAGYVQTVTPGRAGSYFPASGGMVLTASASDDQYVFWEFSGFGNGNCNSSTPSSMKCEGPPTFAEPGVKIQSLWPKLQFNECTGTSFSTAVLSGLLVQRETIQPLRQVTGDPSAPANNLLEADWLGACKLTMGACTEK